VVSDYNRWIIVEKAEIVCLIDLVWMVICAGTERVGWRDVCPFAEIAPRAIDKLTSLGLALHDGPAR
jgi:hypothetical protein